MKRRSSRVLRSKCLLLSWLAVVVWVVSACAPAPAPATGETAVQPPPFEDQAAETPELKPVALGTGETLKVVATTNIVAHVVSEVGDDGIELTQLVPIGADPHTYIATPQDVAAVADAHVIFANGANLEADFLPELVQDTGASVIQVSQGIEFRALDEANADEHEEEDHPEAIDPHTWTTPANVAVFVHNIKDTLSALDPDHAETYEANAETYTAELEMLDEWVRAQIETIPPENRKMVTDHASFGYYADRYGLDQIGALIPAFSTAAEPSAQELAALEDAMGEYEAKAVFVGMTVNPTLAKQVAEDTGTQLVTLYTGSLGHEGSGVESYVDYTCYNTVAIVEALGGKAIVADSPCD